MCDYLTASNVASDNATYRTVVLAASLDVPAAGHSLSLFPLSVCVIFVSLQYIFYGVLNRTCNEKNLYDRDFSGRILPIA